MVRSTKVSTSSPAATALRSKVTQNLKLARVWARRLQGDNDVSRIVADIDEYDALIRTTGRSLADVKALEIGFGARPLRLTALQGMGVDVRGVDIEQPLISLRRDLPRIYRTNGLERAAKSAVRHALFDAADRRALARTLADRGVRPMLDPSRLIVADASEMEFEARSLDLIFSEDVFEHIPKAALERLVERMSGWIAADGLVLVRPMVFTGIAGNHLLDWYPHRVCAGQAPAERAWEHLRGEIRDPNTYLNRLSRADYRVMFSRRFEILEERVALPDLGRMYLTGQVADELRDWPEDELFSNSVLFILRPRGDQRHA